MGEKVRVGIIGCGGIASGKHMPALSKLKNVEMVAFCDDDEERALKAAKDYGVDGAKTYKDYRKLLEDKTIDVVHVCTPNKSHADITVDALESGKHVMCEKPMAKTASDAKRMLDAAKKTGKKLTIGLCKSTCYKTPCCTYVGSVSKCRRAGWRPVNRYRDTCS